MAGSRRLLIAAAGVGLGGGILAAPALGPGPLAVVGPLWDLLLLASLGAIAVALARRIGRIGAALVVAAAVLVPVALVGIDWRGTLGTALPCRRDWAWQPAYFPRASPTRSAVGTVGPVRLKVCYGSPRARGRRMIGGPPVPFGRLWRTGANEPTTIRTDGPLVIAGLPVPAGTISLYTIPGPESWEVILNRATRQWGLESEYTALVRAQEIGRSVVAARPLETFADPLELAIEPTPSGADLTLRWEHTEVRIPIAPQTASRPGQPGR